VHLVPGQPMERQHAATAELDVVRVSPDRQHLHRPHRHSREFI
jgi:hypothetical protein